MMKVVIFQQHPLEMLPPLISLIQILKDLQIEVLYIGLTDTISARSILDRIGIRYFIYPWKIILFREHPFVRIWRELTKPIRHLIFRRWAWRKINAFVKPDDDVVLWAQSMISAAILGDRTLVFNRRFVVTLFDLGDMYGSEFSGFSVQKMFASATIVECEYNRAHILKAEQSLSQLPFVLPNKPYGHPRQRNMEIGNQTIDDIVRFWGDRKVFLYQGSLSADRGELLDVIEWLCEEFPDAVVAVMGQKNSMIDRLITKHANFSHVPFVAPPHHLEITSHAHIGIAIYKGSNAHGLSPINPVYCAPNKIFEYSGFGMPMLCNDIPGLRYTVGLAGAGVCVEELTRKTVVSAAKALFENYESYSVNATHFFDSVDTVSIVKKILSYARS